MYLPLTATNANDGDGGAVQADVGINTFEDNAQKAKKDTGKTGRAGRLDAIAALSAPSIALADCCGRRGSSNGNRRRSAAAALDDGRRCGNRKEGKNCKSSSASELHCEHEKE